MANVDELTTLRVISMVPSENDPKENPTVSVVVEVAGPAIVQPVNRPNRKRVLAPASMILRIVGSQPLV